MRLILTAAVFLTVVPIFAQETTGEIDTETEDSPSSSPNTNPAEPAVILVCPLAGPLRFGLVELVSHALEQAKVDDAAALMFRVDIPGGDAPIAVTMAHLIDTAEVRTIAYMEGSGARSLGALIGYACDDMIMTPGSNIGASSRETSGESKLQTVSVKETLFLHSKIRALAQANGHNADIAQAMLDADIELRRRRDDVGIYAIYAANLDGIRPEDIGGSPDDEVVLRKGTRLTLKAEQAEEYGVTLGTAENLDEAISLLKLASDSHILLEVEPKRTSTEMPRLKDMAGPNLSMRIVSTLFMTVPILGFVLFLIGGISSVFTSRAKTWFVIACVLGLLAFVVGAFAFWVGAWTIGITGIERASEFPTVWAWFFLGVFSSVSSVACLLVGFRKRTVNSQ